MELTVLRREWRRTGAVTLSASVFGVAVLLTFVVVSRLTGYGGAHVSRQLGGGLESVLPPAAAIIAAFAAVSDPCLELHDTLLHSRWARQVFLFTTTYAPGSAAWLPDRLMLVSTAFGPAVVAAWLLGRPDRLLRGDN